MANSTCSGFFERHGYTVEQRKMLFYSACIPVRLLLIVVLFVLAWYLPKTTSWIGVVLGILVFCGSLYFAVHQGCRWWRPVSGVVVSAAIIAVSIAYLVGGEAVVSPLLIGALVLAHLVFGVLWSFKQSPWST